MLRIIHQQESKTNSDPSQDTPVAISPAGENLLELLGYVIADHPVQVKSLLAHYGVATNEGDDEALAKRIVEAIGAGSPDFNMDLAELMIDSSLDSAYDGFNFKSLFSKGDDNGDSSAGGGSGGNNGGGLMSAVAGALGSIGSAVSNRIQNGPAKDQATMQTIQSMMAYKQQQQQQQVKGQQSQQKGKQAMIIGLFVLLGLGLVILFVTGKSDTQPPIQQPLAS
jgi:hypothetical protein